jgi:aspartyl-tRNA(Asn)/glutamyl-tRNA(Gln) amidotransferase subunit C
MSKISREEVRHIARLARLDMPESELDAMSSDLDRILAYVAELEALDTEGIEPTAHAIPLEMPLREDVVSSGMDPELAVANAPKRAGTAFAVPKVIDGEEG